MGQPLGINYKLGATYSAWVHDPLGINGIGLQLLINYIIISSIQLTEENTYNIMDTSLIPRVNFHNKSHSKGSMTLIHYMNVRKVLGFGLL